MFSTTKRRWIVSSKCINYLYNDIGCVLLNNCKCIMDYKAVKDRIKKHEGFRNTVYLDSLGKATIGYGHLLTEEDGTLHQAMLVHFHTSRQLLFLLVL